VGLGVATRAVLLTAGLLFLFPVVLGAIHGYGHGRKR